MKNVKNIETGEIKRTTNIIAAFLVASKKWIYTSKKEWKEAGRPR